MLAYKGFLLFVLLVLSLNGYQMLDGIPITFELAGNVSYTPSSGGVNIPGYKLRIGFSRYRWIGIKFMSLTSESTYDVLVVQRSQTPVGGYYEAQVNDYFVSSGRQNKLLSDSINNMDKEVTTYSDSNYFYVEVFRTKGDTQGQDWQGGEFVKLCFMTYSGNFDQNKWSEHETSCYGYDISENYQSTFRGKSIGSMSVDRQSASLYGGIEGPVLRLDLFWYTENPTLSSNDVYIRIGDKFQDGGLGYDYHKCGEGDFFGSDESDLTADTLWSGYNDGQCTVESSLTSTKIAFSRNVYTGDEFDSLIYEEMEICIVVGNRQSCKDLKFQLLYPVMTVESSFIIFEPFMKCIPAALALLLLAFLS